jgi:hypothetical protein
MTTTSAISSLFPAQETGKRQNRQIVATARMKRAAFAALQGLTG